MKKVLLIFFFLNIGSGIILPRELNVIPKPKEVAFLNESFSISKPTFSIKISVRDTSDFFIPLNELNETFKLLKDMKLAVIKIYQDQFGLVSRIMIKSLRKSVGKKEFFKKIK